MNMSMPQRHGYLRCMVVTRVNGKVKKYTGSAWRVVGNGQLVVSHWWSKIQ